MSRFKWAYFGPSAWECRMPHGSMVVRKLNKMTYTARVEANGQRRGLDAPTAVEAKKGAERLYAEMTADPVE